MPPAPNRTRLAGGVALLAVLAGAAFLIHRVRQPPPDTDDTWVSLTPAASSAGDEACQVYASGHVIHGTRGVSKIERAAAAELLARFRSASSSLASPDARDDAAALRLGQGKTIADVARRGGEEGQQRDFDAVAEAIAAVCRAPAKLADLATVEGAAQTYAGGEFPPVPVTATLTLNYAADGSQNVGVWLASWNDTSFTTRITARGQPGETVTTPLPRAEVAKLMQLTAALPEAAEAAALPAHNYVQATVQLGPQTRHAASSFTVDASGPKLIFADARFSRLIDELRDVHASKQGADPLDLLPGSSVGPGSRTP